MCNRIYNSIKTNFIGLLLLLLITACDSQHPVPRCVPAELFADGTTTSVSAYFDRNSDEFIANDRTLGNVSDRDQVVRWKYTEYVTNGKPLVLAVDGMWTSWVKDYSAFPSSKSKGNFTDAEMEFYDKVLSTERVCGPYRTIERTFVPIGGAECKVSCQLISGVKDKADRGIYGPPCWFKNGYGAYLLFRRPGDPDPNETLNYMRYPVSPVLHIGYEPLELGGKKYFSTQDKKIMDHFCRQIKLEPGWKIYIKILDRHYYDNVGGYAITFIEGIDKEKGSYPFEWVRKKVRDELDKAGEQLFKRIVGNQIFKNFVFSLLTLFLVFGSLAYIFGMVQSPFADVIVRMLKISLVILLISPNSWDFFYNHLLRLFIHGTDQIIAMINSHSAAYRPDKPFAFMDEMIVDKIFSPLIWKVKVRALIIANFGSIFGVIVIIIAVLLYVALCMYAFVIYLTAFIGITFLVGLLPLFFLGILFSQFKSLFDGWLTQCISFAMQAILIFTLLSLFGALIMNYYYRIFGFTVCYNEWLQVKICLFSDSLCLLDKRVFGWTPGQYYDPKVLGFFSSSFNISDYKQSNDHKNPSSARYKFTGGGSYIEVPPDYKHHDFRYIDYPFLDPDAESDGDPFGMSVDKNSPFRTLSHYMNALLTTDQSYAAARVIDNIKKEMNELQQKGKITADSKSKVLKVIDDRDKEDTVNKKNVLDKYRDRSFKDKIIESITTHVISDSVATPTPHERLIKQYDYNLILKIRAGDLILWSEVGSLFLAALLIWQMRAFVQSVAVSLAGGSMMSQTIASMYEGGFLRIFSEIPVIGKVFEKIDNTIDGWKLWSGNLVTKVARSPLNVLHKVPVLNKAVKFTGSVTGALTSSYNEYDRDFSNNFKQLNYIRAFIGAHLGFSPLDAMKYLSGHVIGKLSGSTEGGLIRNALEDRKAALDSLKAHILGPQQYKPSLYIPNKKDEDDDSNPFSKTLPKKSESLLDKKRDIFVNQENLSDALEAREQLNAMLGITEDKNALKRIESDINRLNVALHKHLGDDFDTVIRDYAKSYEPIEHPQNLLDTDLSRLNASLNAKSVDSLSRYASHSDSMDAVDENVARLSVVEQPTDSMAAVSSDHSPDHPHDYNRTADTTPLPNDMANVYSSSESHVKGATTGEDAAVQSSASPALDVTEKGIVRPTIEQPTDGMSAVSSDHSPDHSHDYNRTADTTPLPNDMANVYSSSESHVKGATTGEDAAVQSSASPALDVTEKGIVRPTIEQPTDGMSAVSSDHSPDHSHDYNRTADTTPLPNDMANVYSSSESHVKGATTGEDAAVQSSASPALDVTEKGIVRPTIEQPTDGMSAVSSDHSPDHSHDYNRTADTTPLPNDMANVYSSSESHVKGATAGEDAAVKSSAGHTLDVTEENLVKPAVEQHLEDGAAKVSCGSDGSKSSSSLSESISEKSSDGLHQSIRLSADDDTLKQDSMTTSTPSVKAVADAEFVGSGDVGTQSASSTFSLEQVVHSDAHMDEGSAGVSEGNLDAKISDMGSLRSAVDSCDEQQVHEKDEIVAKNIVETAQSEGSTDYRDGTLQDKSDLEEAVHGIGTSKEESNLSQWNDSEAPSMYYSVGSDVDVFDSSDTQPDSSIYYSVGSDIGIFDSNDTQPDSSKLEDIEKKVSSNVHSESGDKNADNMVMHEKDDVLKSPIDQDIAKTEVYDMLKIQQEVKPELSGDEKTLKHSTVDSGDTSVNMMFRETDSNDDSTSDNTEKGDNVSKQHDEIKDHKDKTASSGSKKEKIDHSDKEMVAQVDRAQDVQISVEQGLKPETAYPTGSEMLRQGMSITEDKISVGSNIDSKQSSGTAKIDTEENKVFGKKKISPSKAKKDYSKPGIFKDIKILLSQCGKQMSNELSNAFDKFFEDSDYNKRGKRKQSKEDVKSMIQHLKDVILSLEAEKSRLSNPDEIRIIEEKIKGVESTINSLLLDQE